MSNSTAWHLDAHRLPYGERVDLWIEDGAFVEGPSHDAAELCPLGGYVAAGLVDAHVHPTIDFARQELAFGSRELFEANLAAHLDAGELLVREIGAVSDANVDAPGPDAPRFLRAGRFLAPDGGYFPGLWDPVAPQDAPGVAAAQAASGARWVKIVGDFPSGPGGEMQVNYDADVMAAIVEAAHAGGARVGVHSVLRETVRAATDAGVDSIEHGPLMDEALLERMVQVGAAWVPTLAFLDGVRRSGGAGFPPSMVATLDEALPELPRALTAALEAGVPVLTGTDALPPGSVPSEVAALVAYGVAPVDAIASATTTARVFLDMPGLRVGDRADLVVYRDDPREHPSSLGRPEVIVFDGRRIR